MSRKRSITSDISVDERIADIVETNPTAALMWPWFITSFDDWGRMDASPRKVKLAIFPAFSFSVDEIRGAIDAFVLSGLVFRYECGGSFYIAIRPRTWLKYQPYLRGTKYSDKDTSRIPAPAAPPWGRDEDEWMLVEMTKRNRRNTEPTEESGHVPYSTNAGGYPGHGTSSGDVGGYPKHSTDSGDVGRYPRYSTNSEDVEECPEHSENIGEYPDSSGNVGDPPEMSEDIPSCQLTSADIHRHSGLSVPSPSPSLSPSPSPSVKDNNPQTPCEGAGDGEQTCRTRRNHQGKGTRRTSSTVLQLQFGDDPLLQKALEQFAEMRKTLRKPLTESGLELIKGQLHRLAPGDQALQIQILEQSVMNSWLGVFPLKHPVSAPGIGLQAAGGHGPPDFDRLRALAREGRL